MTVDSATAASQYTACFYQCITQLMCHIMILFQNGFFIKKIGLSCEESLFKPNYFKTCLKLARYSKTSILTILIHELCLRIRNNMHRFVTHALPDPPLKGQCHEIFSYWFFSWISFPQAPDYTIRAVSNFFKNSRRYLQLQVCHRCRWHWWQIEKIFNQKSFYDLFWTPLGSRVSI